eukprot:m.161357 g.161357  ORF g.161357 m.161357 type:complete len:137 (+) comp20966_c0_seq14:932-1342(+)
MKKLGRISRLVMQSVDRFQMPAPKEFLAKYPTVNADQYQAQYTLYQQHTAGNTAERLSTAFGRPFMQSIFPELRSILIGDKHSGLQPELGEYLTRFETQLYSPVSDVCCTPNAETVVLSLWLFPQSFFFFALESAP